MMFALCTAVTLCAAVGDGVVEGVARDPLGRGAGDDLDALRRVRADAMLDARVQVLGVLAHDDQIDVLVARLNALHRASRAEVGIQVERLAQGHVDGAEALADRRRDRALERDARLADRVEHVLGQRRAVDRDLGFAGIDGTPFEPEPSRLEHGRGRARKLRADAIARDQGDGVHVSQPRRRQVTAPGLRDPKSMPRAAKRSVAVGRS